MAFRGTLPQDLKNLLIDIKIAPTMTDHIAPGSYVHTGFWEAWNGLKVSLKHQLSVSPSSSAIHLILYADFDGLLQGELVMRSSLP